MLHFETADLVVQAHDVRVVLGFGPLQFFSEGLQFSVLLVVVLFELVLFLGERVVPINDFLDGFVLVWVLFLYFLQELLVLFDRGTDLLNTFVLLL